jgi:integrase
VLDRGLVEARPLHPALAVRAGIVEAGLLRADARTLIPQFRTRYVPRDRFLSEPEFHALLLALPPARRLWLLIAVYGGPRRSEIEALRWEEHVNLDSGWILLPGTKTKKSRRRVPIPESLRDELARNWQPSGRVVLPWLNARRDLRAACARIGISPVTANDLRRTFASWLKQKGVDSMVVTRLMGHTSSAMVERVYGHLNDKTLREATNTLPRLEDLDQIPVTKPGLFLRQGRLLRQSPPEKIQQVTSRPEGVEPPTFGFEERDNEPGRRASSLSF